MNAIEVYKKARELGQYVVQREGQPRIAITENTSLRDFIDCLSYDSLAGDDWKVVNKKTFVREGVSFQSIPYTMSINGLNRQLMFFAPFIPGKVGMFTELQNVQNAKVTIEYEEE
jgi:hypothetical protein